MLQFNESVRGLSDGACGAFSRSCDGFLRKNTESITSGGAPELCSFSPSLTEKINDPKCPTAPMNNKISPLLNRRAMAEVAKSQRREVSSDLFAASPQLYSAAQTPLTINGIHMTELATAFSRRVIFRTPIPQNYRPRAPTLKTARAVIEKSRTWHDRYRTVDSFNIFGGPIQAGLRSGKGGPKSARRSHARRNVGARCVDGQRRQGRLGRAQGGGEGRHDSNLPKIKR